MPGRHATEGFEAFFAAQSGALERFATMLTGDPAEGADLAQEALARVYARWEGIRDGHPGAYARRVVVNLVRSAHRSRRLRALRAMPDWARAPAGAAEAGQEKVGESLAVLEALGRLSPVRRATVVLRFYEDLSEHEIARLLDRPLGTVKSDIHRALRQLRPVLERAETGERGR